MKPNPLPSFRIPHSALAKVASFEFRVASCELFFSRLAPLCFLLATLHQPPTTLHAAILTQALPPLRAHNNIHFALPATGQDAERTFVTWSGQARTIHGELDTTAGTLSLLPRLDLGLGEGTNDRGRLGYFVAGTFYGVEITIVPQQFAYPGIVGQVVGETQDTLTIDWPLHTPLERELEFQWGVSVSSNLTPVTSGLWHETYAWPLATTIPIERDGSGNITSWGSPYSLIPASPQRTHATPTVGGHQFVIYSTPEPATWMLVVSGSLVVVVGKRRLMI